MSRKNRFRMYLISRHFRNTWIPGRTTKKWNQFIQCPDWSAQPAHCRSCFPTEGHDLTSSGRPGGHKDRKKTGIWGQTVWPHSRSRYCEKHAPFWSQKVWHLWNNWPLQYTHDFSLVPKCMMPNFEDPSCSSFLIFLHPSCSWNPKQGGPCQPHILVAPNIGVHPPGRTGT